MTMLEPDCVTCGGPIDDWEEGDWECSACADGANEPARDIHYHVGGRANCPACMDYADYLADQEKDG